MTPEFTLKRKAKEAMLAYRVEKELSKDEILELYLNTIYFGHGAYGVESASKAYFGKPVTDLTLAESAMIAGVLRSPGNYSPYLDPEAAKERRDIVLDLMAEAGLHHPRPMRRPPRPRRSSSPASRTSRPRRPTSSSTSKRS